MSTLKATNIKNESSASNNIVLDSGGGVVVSGIITATTFSGNVSGDITIGAGSTSAPSLSPSGDSNTGVFFPAADTIAFAEGGVEAARFDSSGRLLIGTASAYTDVIGGAGGYTGSLWIATADSTGTGPFISAWTSSSSLDQMGTSIVLSRSKGNVVGTHGALASGNAIGSISFNGSDGSKFVSGAVIRAEIDGGVSTNDLPGHLVFSTTADGAMAPTERIRITSGGYFKASNTGSYIGSTGSYHEFSNDAANIVIGARSTSTNAAATCVEAQLPSGASGKLYTGYASSVVYQVLASGNVQNANNSYGSLSDLKLKENIVDASSQWSDIKALQVRKYNFKEGQTHTQIGLIAQEVDLVSPGLVSESPDLDKDGNDLGTVTKSVNYSVLYMKAVKALQEAMERIEQLETSNADLLARVTALEAQ